MWVKCLLAISIAFMGCGATQTQIKTPQPPTVVTYPPVPTVEKRRACNKPPHDEFQLVRCYHIKTAEGQLKVAAVQMKRLTKEFPKSKWVPAAFMAIAEYYFSHNLLNAARVNYLKVLKTSAVGLYPRVLYALGHIYVARGDYDKAHQAFERFRTEFPKESSLACRAAGDVLACGYLGFVASRGIKQPKDSNKASKFYQAVCRGAWSADGPPGGFYIGTSGKTRKGLFHAYCDRQP